MKKTLLTFLLLLLHSFIFAQQRIEIGKAVESGYVITADTAMLHKALQRALGDGTQISSSHIESVNAYHYLVGEGTYKGYYKMIAASLVYDISTRTYYAVKGLGHVTCSSAACQQCRRFTENGKIIGCKCEEHATVSNQCNFGSMELSRFYTSLVFYSTMKPRQ